MATAPDIISRETSLLRSSPSAYDPGVEPTAADLAAERRLRAAQADEAVRLGEEKRQQWYGEGDEDEGKVQARRGLLGPALKVLSTPLYGVVGGAEALLGKGTKKGLANIPANVSEEGTFGDLLRGYDLPQAVSMPLGFALDVALDPVAWVSGGSSTVARMGKGVAGAGARGAALALKSSALKKAYRASEFLPGALSGTDALIPKKVRELGKMAGEADIEFYRAIGGEERIMDPSLVRAAMDRIGLKAAREGWAAVPADDWRKVGFEYSPVESFKRNLKELDELNYPGSDSQSSLVRAFGKGAGESRPVGDGALSSARTAELVANNPELTKANDHLEVLYGLAGETDSALLRSDEMRARREIHDLLKTLESGNVDELKKFNMMAGRSNEELQTFVRRFADLRSGMQQVDRRLAKMLLDGNFSKTIGAYRGMIDLFKTSKLGLNLGVSGMNAVVGNTLMTGMIGLDIADRRLMSTMTRAVKMAVAPTGTKTSKEAFREAKELFSDPEWRKALLMYPEVAKPILGIDPRFLMNPDDYLNETAELLRSALGEGSADDIDRAVSLVRSSFNRAAAARLKKAIGEKGLTSASSAEDVSKAMRGILAKTEPGETVFLSDELFRGEILRIRDALDSRYEKTGNRAYRALSWMLTEPTKAYGSIDQTYRLGLAMHLTGNGITDGELARLASRFRIGPEDFVRESGAAGPRFKLNPMKALEITSEAYGNYMNMPGFVRIMRNFPVLGSPFFAFSYFMGANVAKTALHNPAFFNKIQFFLEELSGEKGPLEKQSLKGKYYSFLDKPGMVKLPFFKENPVYLNVENMLPYYTLSFMSDPERSYSDRFGAEFAKVLDELPILDDPIGQVLVNYAILPMAVGEAQGNFGQRLWPEGASSSQKVASALAATLEAVTPPGPTAALAYLPGRLPESLMPYAPFPYRATQYALEGKTSVGVPGKEPETSRSLRRALGQFAGLPLYSINLEYAEKERRKK